MNMIGNRFAQLRKSRNWSQRDLAKRLGMSARAIMNWENSVFDPSATNIIALALLSHVHQSYINTSRRKV
ncbi:helix-turn-helix domain-containing protein [Bacillota bacterium Meth-B3]